MRAHDHLAKMKWGLTMQAVNGDDFGIVRILETLGLIFKES